MKLSILIPTVFEREDVFMQLKAKLKAQISSPSEVEILHLCTHPVKNGGMHTGDKRQQLLTFAKGDYVVFVDDDDIVSADYVEEILEAIKTGPDVITFNGFMTTNGTDRKDFEIAYGHHYTEHNGILYRPPNHICPIKRELALLVGYDRTTSNGEDYDYCMRLHQLDLIRTNVHIKKFLYHYNYQSTNKLYS